MEEVCYNKVLEQVKAGHQVRARLHVLKHKVDPALICARTTRLAPFSLITWHRPSLSLSCFYVSCLVLGQHESCLFSVRHS